MTYPENPYSHNIEPIGVGANSTQNPLIAEWSQLAEPLFEPPHYKTVPTAQEHLATVAPKAVARQEAGRKLWWGQSSKLDRAIKAYPHQVERITNDNVELHKEWQAKQAGALTELCGLAILGGDDEAASRHYATLQESGEDPQNADEVGLAFLATGQSDRAKTILMSRRSERAMRIHAHNLLDAYNWTGDPDYRSRLLVSLQPAKFLIARLAIIDLANERPIDDLFDMSDKKSGARLALALAVKQHEADIQQNDSYSRYLDKKLPELKVPERTHLPPSEPVKPLTKTEQAKEYVRREGLIFAAIELPLNALEKGLDLLGGTADGPEPAQSRQPKRSPEYEAFLKNVAPVIARNHPQLVEHPAYTEENYGNLSRFDKAGAWNILLARSNAGDYEATVNILGGNADATTKYLAYRNLLHDLDATSAATYLPRLTTSNDRRAATYYTLAAEAVQGKAVSAPPDINLHDEFGSLQQLYVALASRGVDSEVSNSQARQQVLDELELTGLGLVNDQGLDDMLRRIRALNDPAAERTALEQLTRQLGDR